MKIFRMGAAPALRNMADQADAVVEDQGEKPRLQLVSMSANSVRRGRGPLASLMRSNALYSVFQPIVSLRDGAIYSHEALIRGPMDSSFHAPDVLLAAAAHEGLNYEFENFCVTTALTGWGHSKSQVVCSSISVQKYCCKS